MGMNCPHCHKEIELKITGAIPTRVVALSQKISWERELDKVDHEVRVIQGNYGDHQAWCDDDRRKIKPLIERRKFLRGVLGRIV